MASSVFVFGASGHAKVVIDIPERMKGVNVAFVVDDAAPARGAKLCGYAVIGRRAPAEVRGFADREWAPPGVAVRNRRSISRRPRW
jgi:FlaA1/EpsC-like NDP-sugar epimerase